MKTSNLNKKAASIVEYIALLIIIIGAFLVMKNSIQRGFFGKWAQTGQSFAFGRQYDAQKTIDCRFNAAYNIWYDNNCYEYYLNTYCPDHSTCAPCTTTNLCCSAPHTSLGYSNCEEIIMTNIPPPSQLSCFTSACDQLNTKAGS